MAFTLQDALKVKGLAIDALNERRRSFFAYMVTGSGDAMEILDGEGVTDDDFDTMSLEDVQALYEREDIHDAIWFDGGLSEDNARHDADEYHEGYENGAAMVLEHLHKVFGITPEDES